MVHWHAFGCQELLNHYVTNTISWTHSGRIVLRRVNKKNTLAKIASSANNIATIYIWCAIAAKGVAHHKTHTHAVTATLRGGMCLCHLSAPRHTRATTALRRATLGDNSSSWACLVWIDPKLLDRQRHTHTHTHKRPRPLAHPQFHPPTNTCTHAQRRPSPDDTTSFFMGCSRTRTQCVTIWS